MKQGRFCSKLNTCLSMMILIGLASTASLIKTTYQSQAVLNMAALNEATYATFAGGASQNTVPVYETLPSYKDALDVAQPWTQPQNSLITQNDDAGVVRTIALSANNWLYSYNEPNPTKNVQKVNALRFLGKNQVGFFDYNLTLPGNQKFAFIVYDTSILNEDVLKELKALYKPYQLYWDYNATVAVGKKIDFVDSEAYNLIRNRADIKEAMNKINASGKRILLQEDYANYVWKTETATNPHNALFSGGDIFQDKSGLTNGWKIIDFSNLYQFTKPNVDPELYSTDNSNNIMSVDMITKILQRIWTYQYSVNEAVRKLRVWGENINIPTSPYQSQSASSQFYDVMTAFLQQWSRYDKYFALEQSQDYVWINRGNDPWFGPVVRGEWAPGIAGRPASMHFFPKIFNMNYSKNTASTDFFLDNFNGRNLNNRQKISFILDSDNNLIDIVHQKFMYISQFDAQVSEFTRNFSDYAYNVPPDAAYPKKIYEYYQDVQATIKFDFVLTPDLLLQYRDIIKSNPNQKISDSTWETTKTDIIAIKFQDFKIKNDTRNLTDNLKTTKNTIKNIDQYNEQAKNPKYPFSIPPFMLGQVLVENLDPLLRNSFDNKLKELFARPNATDLITRPQKMTISISASDNRFKKLLYRVVQEGFSKPYYIDPSQSIYDWNINWSSRPKPPVSVKSSIVTEYFKA